MEGFDVIVHDAYGEEIHRKWCANLQEAAKAASVLLEYYESHFNSHTQAEVKIVGTWRD